MVKSILCPIDFSESSSVALRWAADLSVRFNCHLIVVYPYRLKELVSGDVIQIKKKNEELAVKKFAALEKSHLQGKNISFDFYPEVGFINDRVDYHLKKDSVFMMVMSRNLQLETNESPEDLVGHSNVPVLVVP